MRTGVMQFAKTISRYKRLGNLSQAWPSCVNVK